MRIEELPLPEAITCRLASLGITELYPPQELAVKRGLLDSDRNMLVVSPTASGKTLLALLFVASLIKERLGKVVYLVPLKALAEEKYGDLKVLDGIEVNGSRIRVGISTGDYDSPGEHLARYDVLVLTNEKFDSLLRHRTSWIKEVAGVVADEIHIVGDSSRGYVLEFVLARALEMNVRILGLSATVANSGEIAKWLKAELVESEWRPVPLKEAVYYDGSLFFSDGSSKNIHVRYGDPVLDLVLDETRAGGQTLVFVDTRRRAASQAKKLSSAVKSLGWPKKETEELSREVLALARTSPEEELSSLLRVGVGYHHAGLNLSLRQKIEEAFRRGVLPVLCSTTTLAAGVNLPARRVVIASMRRYEPSLGRRSLISVTEYKQMSGRAGRPKFDEYGEAVIVARTVEEADFYYEHYVKGVSEPLASRIGSVDALEFLALSYIASRARRGSVARKNVTKFFEEKTLYGLQRGPDTVSTTVKLAIDRLCGYGFLDCEEKLAVSSLGRRVAELYIKPKTASQFLEFSHCVMTDPMLAFAVAATSPDFEPKLSARKESVMHAVLDALHAEKESADCRDLLFYAAEFSGRSLLAALLWVDEKSENDIYSAVGVEPGDLYRITSSLEWILYSYAELAKLSGLDLLYASMRKLGLRVKHGVREELLGLVSLPEIGRSRARALYNAGFTKLEELAQASPSLLASRVSLIGEKLADRIVSEARRLLHEGRGLLGL